MSKPKKTIKLTQGQANQFQNALDDLVTHYGDVAQSWRAMPTAQRETVLQHSPILVAFMQFFEVFNAEHS